METAVGVFSSRERAENALGYLLENGVPEDAIVYLTCSESEAVALGKKIGGFAGGIAGGAVGFGAGMAAASWALIPGAGEVFALGAGAAALLALLGQIAGAAAGAKLTKNVDAEVLRDEQSDEDAKVFLNILKKDRSLIVVRTESHETAKVACVILDRMGITAASAVPDASEMRTTTRRAGNGITVLEVHGRIILGHGNVVLRDAVRDLLAGGSTKIILNLSEVEHIDSAGLGELVRSHTSLRKAGGQLKLLNPSAKIRDMLKMSMLHKVFDVQNDEASAIKSFGKSPRSGVSA
ncbi:MAG TPA: STAS domain-containing protein [Candidatus Acidoferrales bacterium]|nr:STAS domain-containing protein [Candidatus Acidoferrales bacterium]